MDDLFTLTVVEGEQPGSVGWMLGGPDCPVNGALDADVWAWLAEHGFDWDAPEVWVLVTLADEDPKAVNVIASRGYTPPLVNLTPHPITVFPPDTPELYPADGGPVPLAILVPSGVTARLSSVELEPPETVSVAGVDVPVARVAYGPLEGLPGPREGVRYVVSALTAVTSGRPDLVVPHDLVRNERGTVVGCRRFGRLETTGN